MAGKLLVLVLFVIAVTFPLAAHEGHKKKALQTQTLPQTSETMPSAGITTTPQTTTPPQPEPEQMPPMTELMFEHMHNKIIHFPIAFAFAGVLFVLMMPRWPAFAPPARILWAFAAIAAVAAYFTGKSQESAFDGTMLHETVELHEKLGIASGIALWIGLLLLLFPQTKRFAWIWAIVVLVLISVTAFYGGVVAHT